MSAPRFSDRPRWERLAPGEWVLVAGADALAVVRRPAAGELWRVIVMGDGQRMVALCDRPGMDAAMEMAGAAVASVSAAHRRLDGCSPSCSGGLHRGVDCTVVRRALAEERARLERQPVQPVRALPPVDRPLGRPCPHCARLMPCGC